MLKKILKNTFLYNLLKKRYRSFKYYKKVYNEQNNLKAILKSYKIKNYNELNNKNVCKMLNKAKITNNNDLINSLINYANRIDNKLVNEIVYKKCDSFVGALQRILFTNQLLWMTGHNLVGLGRLDKTLERFYLNDDSLNKEKLKELLKEFLITLHKFYNVKSNVLLGDTGQIIISSFANKGLPIPVLRQSTHFFINSLGIFFETLTRIFGSGNFTSIKASKNA